MAQEGHAVSYVSKTLSQAEQRYCNDEREATAIVFMVKHLKRFLRGWKLKLKSGHRPLEFIFASNRTIPKETPKHRISKNQKMGNFAYGF